MEETGRRRLILISKSSELALGEATTKSILRSKKILPSTDPRSILVEEVASKITKHIDKPYNWKFYVIDSPTVNAFCVPGGSIFVYTGLIKMLPNKDALASVLAHEIAHATLRHSAEAMSVRQIGLILQLLFTAVTGIDIGSFGSSMYNVIVGLTHSRSMETEADAVGAQYLVDACINPSVSVKTLKRLDNYEKQTRNSGIEVPAILRTHPTGEDRVNDLKQILQKKELVKKFEYKCSRHGHMLTQAMNDDSFDNYGNKIDTTSKNSKSNN